MIGMFKQVYLDIRKTWWAFAPNSLTEGWCCYWTYWTILMEVTQVTPNGSRLRFVSQINGITRSKEEKKQGEFSIVMFLFCYEYWRILNDFQWSYDFEDVSSVVLAVYQQQHSCTTMVLHPGWCMLLLHGLKGFQNPSWLIPVTLQCWAVPRTYNSTSPSLPKWKPLQHATDEETLYLIDKETKSQRIQYNIYMYQDIISSFPNFSILLDFVSVTSYLISTHWCSCIFSSKMELPKDRNSNNWKWCLNNFEQKQLVQVILYFPGGKHFFFFWKIYF